MKRKPTTKKKASKAAPSKPKKKPARGRWPFADDPSLAVISLKRILKQGHPILYVIHDHEGGWQFLDGGDVTQEDAAVVGLGTMIAHDPTLVETAALPRGFSAFRQSPDAPWVVNPV